MQYPAGALCMRLAPSTTDLVVDGHRYGCSGAAHAFGPDFARLPHVLRILLENSIRCGDETAGSPVGVFRGWLETGTSSDEIAFTPNRVLMHDTTCVPALVDIAAMRDALAGAGEDPLLLNPWLTVDVSVDHSVAVDRYGIRNALAYNMQRELQRNIERYRFLKWATRSLKGVRVHPPGTGIMHTINLERLATVVATRERDGVTWVFPDTLLGTDSHTPMVNGIGVLAWGVGGLEAESVMLGMPVSLRIPEVIGVRLSGALQEGVLATDLALTVTERLRRHGLSGEFVEFFGPGVSTLSAGERSVVANMAPEYGASTGYFPIDEQTLRYLRATGRDERQIALVKAYAQSQRLWFEPTAAPRYSDVVEIDMQLIGMSLAGPRRPQDRLSPAEVAPAVAPWMDTRPEKPAGDIPEGAVAIAAITSCTNTSDPRMIVAAGLLARKARKLGLRPRAWVKTSFAPGSPTAELYLSRTGLLDDLAAIGFDIVGYGCTTCIGNSGPLAPAMSEGIRERGTFPVAVLSGNRNFPGRIHAQIEAAFLASPPLVVAYALAGDVTRNISEEAIACTSDGTEIFLKDLWPSGEEIDAAFAQAANPLDYSSAYDVAESSEVWRRLDAPATPLFPWDAASTYLRRPPFASAIQAARLGRFIAHPLLVLGDDITTDHISPAGQIPTDSEAGQWLIEHGANPEDLNVYAARRGNWEVMLRGMFTNPAARNELDPAIPPGFSVHVPSKRMLPVWHVAEQYRAEQQPVVVVAGERYGTGSSRDWAAKGLSLLGVRAVLASSFERIHRSNLIGMGILPIELPPQSHPSTLRIRAGDRIEIDADPIQLGPGTPITITIHRASGESISLAATAAVETGLEVQILRIGGIIPFILRRSLGSDIHQQESIGDDESFRRQSAPIHRR
jgi:aconitate hydratase